MKTYAFIIAAAILVMGVPNFYKPAEALSCLPVDMYLEGVVGDDTVVIFEGTVTDQFDVTGYTVEVVKVSKALQGYVENELFAYHQKDETWGYLCNSGPKGKGSTGVYIALRDNDTGKYSVTQRLATNDSLVKTLKSDLSDAEIEGGVSEITKTDRLNQIMTTINDLIAEIRLLLKEYTYWKAH